MLEPLGGAEMPAQWTGERMSEQAITVFLYGLFMDESLLLSKGISPLSATIGYVDGYGIRIGSRATLVLEQGSRVYGVLMTMQLKDVLALYSDESVSDYVSETVSVVLSDESRESAVCYNLPEHKLEGTNSEYACSLLFLADELGLPDDYVEQIRKQST